MIYGELRPLGGGDDIPLNKTNLIVGRSESCDITLRFSNVSGKHCRLVLEDGYWYVLDLSSTNGVKVNGVKTNDRRLDPGAKLTIAKHEFQVRYDPVKNGAKGPPPMDSLGSQDVFKRSLMEKVGMKRVSASPTEELPPVEEQPEARNAESQEQTQRPTREPGHYWDELVFD